MELGYFRAVDKSEIALGKMKKVTLYGKEILIVNVNGNYYAVGSECTHFGGNLSEGVLENKVTCPNHKTRFDVPQAKLFLHLSNLLTAQILRTYLNIW